MGTAMLRDLACLLILLLASSGCGDEGSPSAPADSPPELVVPSDAAGFVGQPTSFELSATDPEGGPVTLEVSAVRTLSEFRLGIIPGPWSFDLESGVLNFTPGKQDVPERYFRARATDDEGNEREELFAVTVSFPSIHTEPVQTP
jgi:hypothetical protein